MFPLPYALINLWHPCSPTGAADDGRTSGTSWRTSRTASTHRQRLSTRHVRRRIPAASHHGPPQQRRLRSAPARHGHLRRSAPLLRAATTRRLLRLRTTAARSSRRLRCPAAHGTAPDDGTPRCRTPRSQSIRSRSRWRKLRSPLLLPASPVIPPSSTLLHHYSQLLTLSLYRKAAKARCKVRCYCLREVREQTLVSHPLSSFFSPVVFWLSESETESHPFVG